jgi:glycosyltransferase involved in cell wall biosynthesis
MDRPTLGLGVIARDEEDTLPRLLASCDGAFDEVVLVDTGSTDATVARFEAWAATQPGTRCRVVPFPWIDDFGAARQVALHALATDWGAWADCDDVLHGAGTLRDALAACPPDVVALTGRYDYAPTEFARHVRLVRRGHGRWSGAIHETLGAAGRHGSLDDDQVRWEHRPEPDENGPKPRMRRDLEILRRQVADDPDDARAVFYLAQTHRDLGETDEAIALYERRAEMDGWDEETFYARYQLGLLLADDDWPRAMNTLIAAWEARPQRLEPLQALSANLRHRGAYETADVLARRGLDQPLPPDTLFVATWVYDWGMLFERSITAYWIGEPGHALAACERLLARDDLPALHREQTEHNRRASIDELARRAARNATPGLVD